MSLSERALGWVADRIDTGDFLDLYFVLSDLVDINLTDAELCETACFDSLASEIASEYKPDGKTPIGKLVV